MTTPLEELRRAIMAGDKVKMDPTSIVINDATRLERSAATNFHSLRGRGEPYSLEAVYFQYRNRDLVYTDYVAACDTEKIAKILPLDKRELIPYLEGESKTCVGLASKKPPPGAEAQALKPLISVPKAEPPVVSTQQPVHSEKPEKDRSAFSDSRNMEREQRSLDSVLMVREWEFSGLREKLSQHLAEAKAGKHDTQSKSNNSQAYDPRGDRYTNNQDRFWRENMGTDFQTLGIDMGGSFKKPSASANGSSEKRERPSSRRTSSSRDPKRQRVDPKTLVPIIIVPTGFSTLICHGNVVEFVQDGRFVSAEEMRKNKVPQISKVSQDSAWRVPGRNCSRAEYHVVFNPNRLTSSDWERVVAVVCSGQEWQFKKFPIYDGDLQSFFRRIQGFYFHYEDTAASKTAEAWNIKKLRFSRSQRHTDAQVLVEFWDTLDTFVSRKGKQLRY